MQKRSEKPRFLWGLLTPFISSKLSNVGNLQTTENKFSSFKTWSFHAYFLLLKVYLYFIKNDCFCSYENLEALHGGKDGMNLMKNVLNIAHKLLNVNGKLYMEVDPTHPEKLKEFLKVNPELQLSFAQTYKDFCAKDRFVEIIKIK